MEITPPLIAAAIASLVMHTAVVMLYTVSETALPHSKGSAFTVKIAEIKHTLPTDSKPTPVIKKTLPRPAPVIKKYIAKSTPVAEKKEVVKKEAEVNEVNIEQQQNKILTQVKSKLIEKLNANFNYPKLAQRKNWQGKVILSLRITSSGEIANIQLATSSGYNILDKAAVASLQQVKNLPDISLWFSNGINMHLPVIYRLTES